MKFYVVNLDRAIIASAKTEAELKYEAPFGIVWRGVADSEANALEQANSAFDWLDISSEEEEY